ncbi:putative disease resistance RPP13-like protein 1 [Camellia lanceoleosa]|uniref:Disease resistance RPP13-like protein 1 n=1 Tax=Camellia lanceoleosa TaxID=1840588 RepID=A0ACC0IQA0_9ERIC|nr:putative disease resistance RPP13-like protein 1 [Camellia lanceoleosa]
MVDKLSSFFSNLVSTADVGTSIQNLKKALEDLETLLADAENKQIYHKDIKKWLEEVYRLAYDADDILDDFATDNLEKKLVAEETTIERRPAKCVDGKIALFATSNLYTFLQGLCCCGNKL